MGHDLKNPLGPLVTLLPLLKNACKDPKYCEMLDVIIRNVNYMKNLVQKTLDLAQLSSPNTQLKFEKIDLKEQVDSVIKDNKISFDQISAKVYNKVPEDIQIDADTLRLQEVLNNLISNAVKYRSHECLIEIDAVQTDTDIKVSVKDNGIGMNENQLSHIFVEFYKADPARHDFTSTGLGLSICKRIIEMHGGNIWVSSEGLNMGTTFFFTIPKRNTVSVGVPYQGVSHIIEKVSN
jgi:signal transduction histidine kinase